MKNKIIFLLVSILFTKESFSTMPFPVENFKWGEVEIISLEGEKTNKDEILEGSPLKTLRNKKADENSIEKSFIWCEEKLKQQLNSKIVDCSLEVNRETKILNFIISYGNKSDITHQKPENTNRASLLLEPNLINIENLFSQKFPSLWGSRREIRETPRESRNGLWVIGYSDKKIDQEALDINGLINPYKNHIFDVILTSNLEGDVRNAASLLRWVGLSKEDITYLINNYHNIPPIALNKISHIFVSFHFLIDASLENKLFDYSKSLLRSGAYEARENGLNLMAVLLKRNLSLEHHFDSATEKYIEYLSNESMLEKIKVPAKEILSFKNKTS